MGRSTEELWFIGRLNFGKALRNNKKGLWRYRVDKFRIICKLEEEKLIILVIAIAKRDVVYED